MVTWLDNAFEAVVLGSTVCYASLLGYVLLCWRPRTLLPRTISPPSDAQLSVVIAARDEEQNLGPCLESLLSQPGLAQIVVVDDHSTDGTRVVAKLFMERDPRVSCLAAPPLPAGWIGKSHALQFGAGLVRTPFLLFTDADVIFGPGILAEALHYATTNQLDHLGGHFFVDCRTVAEEICAPVLTLSSALALFGTAELQGAGTGAFNLVRTEVYAKHGGHASIKTEIVDDVALARHLKAAGAESRFVAMGGNLQVRLFVGWTGFIKAASRSAVPFLRWNSIGVMAATALCMWLALVPGLVLFGMPMAHQFSAVHAQYPLARWLAPAPFLLGIAALFFSRRFHNGRLVFQLCFPVALFLLAASVFAAALAQTRGRPVIWRGRAYAPE